MLYLKEFSILDENGENVILELEQRRIFNNYYPLGIFTHKSFKNIKFEPITIFYGGNGSGKTTLLNMISEKLKASKISQTGFSSHFYKYVDMCEYEMCYEEPTEVKLISSDDVFDYLLDIKSINSRVNRRKEEISREYLNMKFNSRDYSLDEYQELRDAYDSKKQTMSRFVRDRLGNNNIPAQSNGESALMYWEREIKENSIYILDEPENSLSAENQIKLKKFIEDSTRFYNCQFIISTHSPFLLNLNDALIYDLDETPVTTKKWNELDNVKLYYNFFKEREDEF